MRQEETTHEIDKLKTRLQEVAETRKLVKKIEHTVKFFELETQKSLDVIRLTLTDHKKQMNEISRHVIDVEHMFTSRDMKQAQLEALIFRQREELQGIIAGQAEENRQEISRLEGIDREIMAKVNGFDLRMKNFEAAMTERFRLEMQ